MPTNLERELLFTGKPGYPYQGERTMERKRGYTVTGQPYKLYLRSPEWAEVKRRYRSSKLPQTCVVCGSKKVDLHHKTYERLGKERLTDLVPLCRSHHKWLHRRVKAGTASLWSGPRVIRRVKKRKG
jgi:hypothetical protein